MPARTHGLTSHPLYILWYSMIRRCENPVDTAYRFYGGRGISVCSTWKESVKEFIDYVSQMPNYNQPEYTLDRIDGNKNYEPGNVRWASRKQQHRNKSSNRLITYQNKTMCIAAWAEYLKVPVYLLHSRLRRDWTVERAFSTPPSIVRKENYEYSK